MEKQCSRCSTIKEETSFYRAKTGELHPWCKDCHAIYRKSKKFVGELPATRECSTCKEVKPASDYHKHSRSGIAYNCRACMRTYRASWKQKRIENLPVVIDKRCKLCAITQPACNFQPNGCYPDGYTPTCRQCDTLLRRRSKYIGFKDEMLEVESCEICGERFKNTKAKHVDHDHETGVVRGILCDACNLGLGKFKDDPEILQRAARYLLSARVIKPCA